MDETVTGLWPMSSKTNRHHKQLFTSPTRRAFLRAPGVTSLSPSMNQIDPSTVLAQNECGFCKRMEKHTIVPIQEEDLHWAKKYNTHVEGNPPVAHFVLRRKRPQESHDPSEIEKRNIASVREENWHLAHQNELTDHERALSGGVSSEKFEVFISCNLVQFILNGALPEIQRHNGRN